MEKITISLLTNVDGVHVNKEKEIIYYGDSFYLLTYLIADHAIVSYNGIEIISNLFLYNKHFLSIESTPLQNATSMVYLNFNGFLSLYIDILRKAEFEDSPNGNTSKETYFEALDAVRKESIEIQKAIDFQEYLFMSNEQLVSQYEKLQGYNDEYFTRYLIEELGGII